MNYSTTVHSTIPMLGRADLVRLLVFDPAGELLDNCANKIGYESTTQESPILADDLTEAVTEETTRLPEGAEK
jgi:hypothetical protein